MKKNIISKILLLPILSVVVLIIMSAVLLSKPLAAYEGAADSLTSELGILLPEFPDHPQEGIYADNSLSDSSIGITTDSHTLPAGSYNITVYYIAESNMNTLTLRTSDTYHPVVSGYDHISIPESDGSGYSFAINSLTRLKDLTVTLDFEGDGYIYVTGYKIEGTRHLSSHIIEAAFLILIMINIVVIFLCKRSSKDHIPPKDISKDTSVSFFNNARSYDIAALIIIIIGALVRMIQLGYIPGWGGVAQDEAFAGYEAYSLLHYGIDSHGYHMPVYLEAWGSGMNALATYLEIPFIKLLGLNSLSIRIPHMIIGILILPAFYGCCKTARNESFGLIGLFILAISPWNIIASRWGLEANLLPAFLVFGMYYMLKAAKNKYMIYPSMICYGLSLYCYAAAWPVIPLIIGCSLIYLIIKRYIYPDKHLFIAILILGIIASPLLLFVLVNTDHLVEIVTPLISIPRLTVFRSSEVALTPSVMMQRLCEMFNMLFITQDDGLGVNAVPGYGLYYIIGPIFIVIGLIASVYKIFKSAVTKKDIVSLNTLFIVWFIWCLLHGCLVESDLTRINVIYVPLTYLIAEGIYTVIALAGTLIRSGTNIRLPMITTSAIITVLFAICFVKFEITYMSDDYNSDNVIRYDHGLTECLKKAHELGSEDININILYPLILFEDKIPAPDYIDSVIYKDVHAAFLEPESFGDYNVGSFTDTVPQAGSVYICKANDTESIAYFTDNNIQQTQYGTYIIALKK